MKRAARTIAFFAVVLIAVCRSLAGASAQENTIRVKLEVIGDQNVDSEADKFIRKAVAMLKDVDLVEDGPQIYMHVIARRIVTNTGRRIGYVMAVASAQIMEVELRDNSPFICSDYSGLWLETGPDLRGLCDKCISAMDYGVFSRMRTAGSKK